ncbi:MAG TPA: zinc ABC transporter substrate-binding protein [Actinomycetota bacterium]|nr:zinc ABC transporter substrate-binding protein [Actinomycetota bacterium]
MTWPRRLLLSMLCISCAACGPVGALERPDVSGRRINAVATTGMVADVVANVGRERVDVIPLMGPGIDPHLYKASEGDVTRVGEADIVFYSGLHLEARMAEVFERMGSFVEAVAVTDGMPRERLLAPPAFAGQFDPHVWFDVDLWASTVDEVSDALIDLDPEHADLYRDNADAYRAELDDLDAYVRTQAERVPAEQRVLITAHDAFGYFGRAYGFEVRGLQGISTVSEAGAGDLQELADFIVERRIPALFIESSVPVRFVEAVREAVRARGFETSIGGELFSDAMGDPGTAEGTYVGMVRHNIDTIVGALLGGKV